MSEVTEPQNTDRQAALYGLAAVALWSTVASAFKFSLNHVSPLVLLTIAAVTSWLFFALLISYQRGWRSFLIIDSRSLLMGLAIGALNPTLYYLLLFAAYDQLPAQEAMALNYTWALTLPLLAAPLLRQKLTVRECLAAAISYGGVFIIATRGNVFELGFVNPIGVGLALSSTVIWALCWIANTHLKLLPSQGLFLNFTAATPLLMLASFLFDDLTALPIAGLLGGVYIGFFEMGLSFMLWLSAMLLASSTVKISTLIFLSPPASLCFIWLVLGEPVMLSTVVGLSLILGGLSLQHYRRRGGLLQSG